MRAEPNRSGIKLLVGVAPMVAIALLVAGCPPGADCGNGVIEDGEECDDENSDFDDGCSSSCTVEPGYICTSEPSECNPAPFCGDGNTDTGEECDDGNTVGGDGCDSQCRIETGTCGDGTVDTGEDCDATGESATCDADCTTASCGDGTVNMTAGEQCDDGNTTDGDGCNATCIIEGCGDGMIDPGEDCDAMGESATCDADCTNVMCGDSTVNMTAGEECDDGNTTPGDGCSDTCTFEGVCGNGVVEPGEDCDDAGESATCDIDCTNVMCGDGTLNTTAGEECDDGNTTPGDGCSATCIIELIDRDNFEEFVGASGDGFDLSDTLLDFMPYAGSYGVVALPAGAFPDTPGSGAVSSTDLVSSIGDDDSVQIVFTGAFTFPFFGTAYGDVWVGSNGYLTFGAGDTDATQTVAEHFALPRISAFFADLSPQSGTGLVVDEFTDRVSITWDSSPSAGMADSNSAQITLFTDGRVTITYQTVQLTDAIVGISAGDSLGAPPAESDFSAAAGVAPTPEDLVINELFANDSTIDANCDGVTTGQADEFVEIVNVSGSPLDLTGIEVRDATSLRHTFGMRGLAPGAVIVVYAGGTAACSGVPAVLTSGGSLSLNNTGDTITVQTGGATVICEATYGGTSTGVSDTLDPDLNDATAGTGVGPFVRHNVATGSSTDFSPGFRIDGSPF